jgi:hypothetical protein
MEKEEKTVVPEAKVSTYVPKQLSNFVPSQDSKLTGTKIETIHNKSVNPKYEAEKLDG